jgi:hypothetical protein
MEQDIAVASVADTVLRTRARGEEAGGGAAGAASAAAGPLESSAPLVERFESLHQRVAQAAEQVARGGGGPDPRGPSGPLLSWARLRRPALWALAGAICVGALAVWMRPALVTTGSGGGANGEQDDDEERHPSVLKVVAVAAGAGVLVGGADLVGGARR